jgi:hypothetical protein
MIFTLNIIYFYISFTYSGDIIPLNFPWTFIWLRNLWILSVYEEDIYYSLLYYIIIFKISLLYNLFMFCI